MKIYRLDELAQALGSTLHCSQERIDRGVADRLSKVIDMNKHGRPESLVHQIINSSVIKANKAFYSMFKFFSNFVNTGV